jgi:CRP-like cAMP-binding protein
VAHPEQNEIIARLPAADSRALLKRAKRIALRRGVVLHQPGGVIEHVYFPLGGMVSLITVMNEGEAVETGIVGRDGVVGGSIGGNSGISFSQAVVQVPAEGWLVPASDFRDQYDAGSDLMRLTNKYQTFILKQAQQSAACHALHTVEARLARWLLQSRDALDTDTVELTQEFISHMLGVQRSTVSLSAHALRQAGLIRRETIESLALPESCPPRKPCCAVRTQTYSMRPQDFADARAERP